MISNQNPIVFKSIFKAHPNYNIEVTYQPPEQLNNLSWKDGMIEDFALLFPPQD
jgi:hypothetical protein